MTMPMVARLKEALFGLDLVAFQHWNHHDAFSIPQVSVQALQLLPPTTALLHLYRKK